MRTPIIAANWKMYKTIDEAKKFVLELKNLVSEIKDREIVVCPPFTALSTVSDIISSSNISLGAQNVFYEKEGAYTGEISPLMLKSLGCKYVIIGHSERRKHFLENDETINKKIKASFSYNLIPILCVGEKLEEREKGLTEKIVLEQIEKDFEGLTKKEAEKIVIAYEPIWAIGTGKNATPSDANDVIKLIRKKIEEKYQDAANKVRIQYGGSVKPENIDSFMSEENIDGALVGGASLEINSFLRIVKFKTSTYKMEI